MTRLSLADYVTRNSPLISASHPFSEPPLSANANAYFLHSCSFGRAVPFEHSECEFESECCGASTALGQLRNFWREDRATHRELAVATGATATDVCFFGGWIAGQVRSREIPREARVLATATCAHGLLTLCCCTCALPCNYCNWRAVSPRGVRASQVDADAGTERALGRVGRACSSRSVSDECGLEPAESMRADADAACWTSGIGRSQVVANGFVDVGAGRLRGCCLCLFSRRHRRRHRRRRRLPLRSCIVLNLLPLPKSRAIHAVSCSTARSSIRPHARSHSLTRSRSSPSAYQRQRRALYLDYEYEYADCRPRLHSVLAPQCWQSKGERLDPKHLSIATKPFFWGLFELLYFLINTFMYSYNPTAYSPYKYNNHRRSVTFKTG